MLRPHGHISYIHTDVDMEIIKEDMQALIESGVDGFVFGALTADRHIDANKCRQVVKNARGLPVTFHRAFDMSIPAKKEETIDKIAECGFKRILSSGFAETAEVGINTLAEMKKYISEKGYDLLVMPGCGVTPTNAEQILQTSECKEFHASAKVKLNECIPSHPSDSTAISREIDNNSYAETSAEIVKKLANHGKMYS